MIRWHTTPEPIVGRWPEGKGAPLLGAWNEPLNSDAGLEPFVADAADEFGELSDIGAFGVEFAGAQADGAIFVRGIVVSAQDAGGDAAKVGRGSKPFKDFEAILLRHVKVEQDEVGDGMGGFIGKGRLALEIGEDFFAIGNELEGTTELAAIKDASEQKGIVEVIFGDKNGC